MRPIEVAIADDSYVIRTVLEMIIRSQPDMRVVASVENGELALKAIEEKQPDILLLDIEMPVMDGITTLKHLFKQRTKTKVIVLSTLTAKHAPVTIHALSLGAAAYLQKPSTQGNRKSIEEISARLLDLIRNLYGTPHDIPAIEIEKVSPSHEPLKPVRPEIVVIGSSTGGPNALSVVLKQVQKPVPVPVVIIQHMPESFIPQLAKRLAQDADIEVLVAAQNMRIEAGKVYIGPGEIHTEIAINDSGHFYFNLVDGPPEVFCKPSVNPLFRSAARLYRNRTLGVVLTGMGDDGLDGSRQIKKFGGKLIAQDSHTSVVWGMPKAVVAENLADEVLPLDKIASEISMRIQKKG